MTLVQQNWAWISSNGLVAAILAATCFGLGWAAATLFFQERMAVLKERQTKPESQASKSFTYPNEGRHGKNVLSNSTDHAVVGEHNSFRAVVPANSKLRIKLEGPAPKNSSDIGPSWSYGVGPINWTANLYEPELGGSQSFVAEAGTADLMLKFTRPGEVRIIAFEGESPSPSWTKVIRVRVQ
ncbi:MAG: hypothetical protein V4754_07435 [Pseudomonadota bacterium]